MSVEVASLSREKEIYKVTIVGSIVNFVLLAFKFVAGILGHSAAMLADAVHSLSDFVTDVIVLVFVRISNKPQDKDHDYGHGKYETLATAIIGIITGGIRHFVEWCFFYLGFYERRTTGGTWNGGTDSCSYFYFAEGDIISIYSY